MSKELKFNDLTVGQQLEPFINPPISRVQLAQYAGASGDFNPLHLDDEFAQKIGMDGVIAHGMLIMGFLGQYVMKIAGKQAMLTNFRMRFGAMTVPGDQIHCSAQVDKVYEENGNKIAILELTAEEEEEEEGKTVGTGIAELRFYE